MIIVTGCTGFIGFHLSKKLLFQNIPVIGIDTLDSLVNPLNDWRLKQLRGYGLKFLDVDIVNKAKLNKRISEENIQKIEGVYDNKKALNAPPKVSPMIIDFIWYLAAYSPAANAAAPWPAINTS